MNIPPMPGTEESDGELHGVLAVRGQVLRRARKVPAEEGAVQQDVAGVPHPRLKSVLRVTQHNGVTYVTVLELGGCSEPEVVPTATAVAVGEEGALEPSTRPKLLLQAVRER